VAPRRVDCEPALGHRSPTPTPVPRPNRPATVATPTWAPLASTVCARVAPVTAPAERPSQLPPAVERPLFQAGSASVGARVPNRSPYPAPETPAPRSGSRRRAWWVKRAPPASPTAAPPIT